MSTIVRCAAYSSLALILLFGPAVAGLSNKGGAGRQVQTQPKKPAAQASPRFSVLSHDEATSWAKVLTKNFDAFQITAEETDKPSQAGGAAANRPAAAGAANQKEKVPTGRLCIAKTGDTVTGPCPTVQPGVIQQPNAQEEFSTLQALVALLDQANFKGVTPDPDFLIITNPRKLPAGQVSPFWKAIQKYLSRPAQDLSLVWPARDFGEFLIIVPRIGAKDSAASTAALIKQDLESVEDAYENSLNPPNLSSGTACASQAEPAPDNCRDAIIAIERWLNQNTVPLGYLSPRDLALALWELKTPAIRPHSSAITFVPNATLDADQAYIAANAIEREVLYAKARSASKPAQPSKKDDSGKSETPPVVVTTKSITSTSKISGGKHFPPDTVTEVDTSTSTQSKPAASDGSGTDTSQKSQSATDASQGSAKDGTAPPASAKKDASSKDGKPDTPSPASSSTDEPAEFDNVVRLFHLRRATEIAAAINQAALKDSPFVTTLASNPQDDLVMILPSAGKHATDIKRAIAILDQPRPQLSLQVWHYQMSTKNKKSEKPFWAMFGSGQNDRKLQDGYEKFRDAVLEANRRMTAALERGYAAAIKDAAEKTGADKPYSDMFNPVFADYLTGRYQNCVRADKYCLGYYDALDVANGKRTGEDRVAGASLSRLVLLVAASKDEHARTLVKDIIDAMEKNSNLAPESCVDAKDIDKEDAACLDFDQFKERFEILSDPKNLHALQAALLDFLFQYKWTVTYPNDFVPYDLQRTAHALDDLLQPLVEAFNHDLDHYVERVLGAKTRANDVAGLVNKGQIQVSTLSGSAASVQGQVKNYFDITPPMSLHDILNTSNQSNLATALKGVLEPKEILVLQSLANVGNQPRITAELSENASLKITPISLDTASAAELDVDFDVGETTAPATSGVSSPPKDLLDRVADHHVTTHVRVESVKLFQLSSFTMTLTHPQRGTPIPVIGWGWEAIFGTTPYVGNLFRLPPYSETVDNRSVAVVRAVVVPTAMDIGLGLRFEGDRVWDPVTGTTALVSSAEEAGGKLRPFHKKMLQCISQGDPLGNDCANVTLSGMVEDLRRPQSH
jgi:hypothetical protein